MDYKTPFAAYQELLLENSRLTTENNRLKTQFGVGQQAVVDQNETQKGEMVPAINKASESKEKIQLFMSLFKSRVDVYAKRWQNKEGKSGYTPVCLNEWKPGLCSKPRVRCIDCASKSYGVFRNLCPGNELGSLKDDDEDKPWEPKQARIKLSSIDFPASATIVKSNMLYVAKPGFSQQALNGLKRLSAFRNPEFYKAQAMRMPTFNKPRIISCSDETEKYLCLPRGCEPDLTNLLNECNVHATWQDERNCGRPIDVEFNGLMRSIL